MAAKKEQARPPKLYEIIIGAILSLILGVLLAVVYLAFKPVIQVNERPPESERETAAVYYVPGERGGSESDTWQVKERALISGREGQYQLNERELNRWAASVYRPDPERAGGQFYLDPTPPVFRIEDGRIEIALRFDAVVFGMSREFLGQARGVFRERNGVFAFAAEELYVGSCPAPKAFGLDRWVLGRLAASFPPSDELAEAWTRVSEVVLDENVLKVTHP